MLRESLRVNLKKLKRIFACDYFVILILTIIFIIYQNIFVILLALIYLILFKNGKNILIYLSLIILILIRLVLFDNLNTYYYINKVNSNYYSAISFSNKIKLYNAKELQYGDLIRLEIKEFEALDKVVTIKMHIVIKSMIQK